MSTNPFQSPQTTEDALPAPPPSVSWKAVAVRWEKLRILFNGLVGSAGLLAIAIYAGPLDWVLLVAGAVGWAGAANACYLLGPIAQMYLCWFAESKDESRISPSQQLAGSAGLTWLLFASGCGFSMLLTFWVATFELPRAMLGMP